MIFFLHTSRHLWSYGDSMCDKGLLKTQNKEKKEQILGLW